MSRLIQWEAEKAVDFNFFKMQLNEKHIMLLLGENVLCRLVLRKQDFCTYFQVRELN